MVILDPISGITSGRRWVFSSCLKTCRDNRGNTHFEEPKEKTLMRSKTLAVPVSIIFLMTFAVAAFGGVTNPDTLTELAQARQAAQQYLNSELPAWDGVADGYVQASPRVPNMGYHYVNFALLDDVFDVEAPEILLFDDAGNGRRLVGVEYVVAGVAAPEGFTGSEDDWHVHLASCHYADGYEVEEPNPANCPFTSPGGAPLTLWHPDIWALHVWLWEGNPDGIFAEFNPNV
jgi:hypothetical protein